MKASLRPLLFAMKFKAILGGKLPDQQIEFKPPRNLLSIISRYCETFSFIANRPVSKAASITELRPASRRSRAGRPLARCQSHCRVPRLRSGWCAVGEGSGGG